jgi:hypothetical protein
MTTAAAEQDEVKTIPAIDVRGKNNNADDPDKKNKDGGDSDGDGDGDSDGDGDDDGGTMLANGTEVSRRRCSRTARRCLGATLTRRESEAMPIYLNKTLLYLITFY